MVLKSLYIWFESCVHGSQLTSPQGWESEDMVLALLKICSWLRENSLIVLSISVNQECVCVHAYVSQRSQITSRSTIVQLQLFHLKRKKKCLFKKKSALRLLKLKILWNGNNWVSICLGLYVYTPKMMAEWNLLLWNQWGLWDDNGSWTERGIEGL